MVTKLYAELLGQSCRSFIHSKGSQGSFYCFLARGLLPVQCATGDLQLLFAKRCRGC
jgi:hypothetical protein